MTSSINNKANTVMEAIKPQASTPNFVLTLLAACSNSVPSGQEGEAKLCEQISGLLQDKVMAVQELNLIYSYKFGLSINAALQFIGFSGGVQEFLNLQKRFSFDGGSVSLKPVIVVTNEEAPADDKLGVSEDKSAANDEVAAPEDCALAAFLDFDFHAKNVDDDDAATSAAATDSTDDLEIDSQSDVDSEVDIPSWHSLGNRLIATLGSTEDDGCLDADGWEVVGGEDGEDVAAWSDVGNRIVMACKRGRDSESSPDASEWHSVGARAIRALYTEQPGPDAVEWRSVGARVLSRLEADGDDN